MVAVASSCTLVQLGGFGAGSNMPSNLTSLKRRALGMRQTGANAAQ